MLFQDSEVSDGTRGAHGHGPKAFEVYSYCIIQHLVDCVCINNFLYIGPTF